jgi:cytoskeletal protein RodZ
MFELGPALREARERQRLTLQQVEADTKIRSRYVRALEDEEFSILPGATYAKGFLRAYAEYLGLDGQLFIDEFNHRHFDPRLEDEQIYPRSRPTPRRQRRESNLVMIVLAAIVSISALVFLAASSGDENRPGLPLDTGTDTQTTPGVTTHKGPEPPVTTAKKQKARKQAKARRTRVAARFTAVLTASADCWISVLKSGPQAAAVLSARGSDLSDYTLAPGESVRFTSRRPVLIQVARPSSATLTVNGRTVPLPTAVATAHLQLTRRGVAGA